MSEPPDPQAEEAQSVEVSAMGGDECAAQNERYILESIRAQAAALPFPILDQSRQDLFQSFFIGGFECATYRRRDGRRLDLLAATRHDVHAASDYRMLAQHGSRTVRDGLRWHRIERSPGR